MSKKKNLLLVAMSVIIMLLLGVSFTLAYLLDQRTAKNNFTFGEVKVEVVGNSWGKNVPDNEILAPGAVIQRDPTIKNTGNVPAYVRAVVTVSQPDLANEQNILDFIDMNALGNGWKVAAADAQQGKNWGATNTITVVYTNPINANDSTTPIFTGFKVKTYDKGEAFLNGANEGFDILVKVDAVQTTNGENVFMNAEQAFTTVLG